MPLYILLLYVLCIIIYNKSDERCQNANNAKIIPNKIRTLKPPKPALPLELALT